MIGQTQGDQALLFDKLTNDDEEYILAKRQLQPGSKSMCSIS